LDTAGREERSILSTLGMGLFHQAIAGETVCGDAYAVIDQGSTIVVAVADGLGHGELAAVASRNAIAFVQANVHLTPMALVEACHAALRGTRGAVLAVVKIDRAGKTLTHAGLGNVETRIVGVAKTHYPVTVNGIAGQQARPFREASFPFYPGDLLIMHTDGISERFITNTASRRLDPQTLANRIAQEHGNSLDDQLLLIVRDEP
jgi:serine phosphatase RsbU (regulator of sigma subunit)